MTTVVVSVVKALTSYFNTGDGKRSTAEWMQELKNLTPEEKHDLATQACEVMGCTLK